MRMLFITTCASLAVLAARVPAEGSGALPPGYATTRTGDVHDFDYFAGACTTTQRRLNARGVGSTEWEEFPATLCMSLYLGGMVTVDELYFPTKGWAGFTVRTFDLEKRQWSIYWVSSTTGRMDVPVVGGFDGDRRRILRRRSRQRSSGEGPLYLDQARSRSRALGTGVFV
jgi:hypothetical protein